MAKFFPVVLMSLLVATVAMAQCPVPPPPGTEVQIAPTLTVVSMECPAGLMDGRSIIEHKMTQYYENNRSISMWMRPYPPRGMTEVVFVLQQGFGDMDKIASVDAKVVGPDGGQTIELKRMRPGVYCGHADFANGWNKVQAWITAPTSTSLRTFNFWAGDYQDKPRMVNWMCPRCRVMTVSTSCPACCP